MCTLLVYERPLAWGRSSRLTNVIKGTSMLKLSSRHFDDLVNVGLLSYEEGEPEQLIQPPLKKLQTRER
ncbi:hypothetical protein Pyn_24910 [Prunus yedoensis var. nudiflora]|uniref:Uncharacterized protein n=1 Tax=Prunus yedoensis var. nudiflora TaxID=2094558 RepID=A0A314XGC4_PRUYE|nr:hypothetical protein Pyn_24910 [Prunus yedoensis var. nudiflora]